MSSSGKTLAWLQETSIIMYLINYHHFCTLTDRVLSTMIAYTDANGQIRKVAKVKMPLAFVARKKTLTIRSIRKRNISCLAQIALFYCFVSIDEA